MSLSKILYPLLSTGSTKENRKMSHQHDCKHVERDVMSKIFYPLLSTGSTKEDRKMSQHDCKHVDRDVMSRHCILCKVLVQPRKRGICPNMTEKLLTGM